MGAGGGMFPPVVTAVTGPGPICTVPPSFLEPPSHGAHFSEPSSQPQARTGRKRQLERALR